MTYCSGLFFLVAIASAAVGRIGAPVVELVWVELVFGASLFASIVAWVLAPRAESTLIAAGADAPERSAR